MLECKIYPAAEMFAYLHTKDKEATNRKLNRYDVCYFANDFGDKLNYNITAINDPFKVFCVFDLGFDPNTNFQKLKDFLYYLLAVEDFGWRPDEQMETYMKREGHCITRQTIAKYLKYLEEIGFFGRHGDCVYYRVWKDEYLRQHEEIISHEEYKKMWAAYWDKRNNEGWGAQRAMAYVKEQMGGAPRKQVSVAKNAFHLKEINYLLDLVTKDYLDAA